MPPFFLAATLLLLPYQHLLWMQSDPRGAAAPAGAAAGTLSDLQGNHRPLLVFSPTDHDTRLVDQARLLQDGAAHLRERQVVFVPLIAQEESTSWAKNLDKDLVVRVSNDVGKLRRRFDVSPAEFTVILVGKDGGEKFRAHTPVTIERLNTTIDAMPMRQQEVQDGHTE